MSVFSVRILRSSIVTGAKSSQLYDDKYRLRLRGTANMIKNGSNFGTALTVRRSCMVPLSFVWKATYGTPHTRRAG